MDVPVIAIDGPSASGKGTVAEKVARELGFRYLDSGALYRLVTLAALQAKTDFGDEAALSRIAGSMDIDFRQGRTWLAGRDVTAALRAEEVSAAASRVAKTSPSPRSRAEDPCHQPPPGPQTHGSARRSSAMCDL